ncbi:hypothetical protein FACS1894166_01140 [Bacilli bacterium]|nr:hypothetical protein FACS1894166_01140 [Bacilli bacterium]
MIMMLSILGMRGNTVAMMTLYGGTTLQPMSQEGYISSNFGKQNQDGFPMGAMKLNIVITAITVAVWLIIPDFIVGI